MNHTHIALVETDQAAIAKAKQALNDMQIIAIILCSKRWTVELAERFQENIQDISSGLEASTRWLSTQRE